MSEAKHTMVIINGCAPGRTEEQKANARLIIRAVNSHQQLLEACEALMFYEHTTGNETYRPDWSDIVRQVAAAKAAAKGETHETS